MTDTSDETPTTAGATVLTGAAQPASKPASAADEHLVEAAAEHRRPVPEGGEHGAHPTDRKYIEIAAILALITAVEVAISYIKGLGATSAPLLLILAAVKFFLVGAYFMHLKFDNEVLRRMFLTGIVLALAVYIVVFLLLGVFSASHGAHG
jgi:cytochrome c oxidase subunit 4